MTSDIYGFLWAYTWFCFFWTNVQVQNNTLNPTWTENEFTFSAPPEGGILRIELFDSDEGISDDDFLGMLALQVCSSPFLF